MKIDEKACGGIIIKGKKVLMVNQVKGFIGFPKGHVADGETEEQTAIREIKEETNVDVILDSRKKYKIYYKPKNNINKEVVYFIGKVKDDRSIKPQKEEVTEVIWVDIDKVMDILTFDNIKDMWKEVLRDLSVK